MGANIECDFRPSVERINDLEAIPLDPLYTSRPLRTRLTLYPQKCNYNCDEPAFLQATNQANIQDKIMGNLELVSVFQFKTRQSSHIAAALAGGLLLSNDFPSLLQEIGILFDCRAGFVADGALGARPRDFLNRFFAAQWDNGRNRYHGVWAGLWREFASILNDGPATWVSALGVRRPSVPTFCLVLRYQARDVYPLARPTILDASWYPEHFPSPQPSNWCQGAHCAPHGGHPMSLRPDLNLPLREEFIHRDVLRSADWVRAWGWLQPDSAVPPPSLLDSRRHHWELLRKGYNEIDAWLAKP